MILRNRVTGFFAAAALLLASCGGGGGGGGGGGAPAPTTPTSVFAVPAQESLSTTDVEKIVAQSVEEAAARSRPATIAVVDRVGNVLAVFRMTGAPLNLIVKSPDGIRPGNPGNNVVKTDLENLDVQGELGAFGVSPTAPAAAAGAIAKAITGAYLSSSGNAFSTRTASQIVQEHFPPAPGQTTGLESGPLFGVQFSQLPCSDLSARFGAAGGAALIGPKRSPLGLSADPGGLPLYKNGVVVGGIGVMSDPVYSYDPNIIDVDSDADEFIALAGESGYAPADSIKANRITVDGTSLRFTDAATGGLSTNPANARAFAALNGALGALLPVTGYFGGAIIAGTAYGSVASGIRQASAGERGSSTITHPDAFILTGGTGADTNRFTIRAGTDAGDVAQPLTATEVRTILDEAFLIMSRARAQIRQPLDSRAQVSISVVDTRGAPLGIVRSPDAPIFGTDVSLQKARTAAFFSGTRAMTDLAAVADPLQGTLPFLSDPRAVPAAARTFFNDPTAFTGKNAFGDRTVGNLARPYFPDGEVGRPNGPFSQPFARWSPFSTGLQSGLIVTDVTQHLLFILGASGTDVQQRCTFLPDAAAGQNRLQNGMQIFPGSVPIYRGSTLVGAIGVSGDGIDQDDMISFLGLHNAGVKVGSIGNADPAIRSDTIVVPVGAGVRLRYIACPFAPFLDTTDQNVCSGK